MKRKRILITIIIAITLCTIAFAFSYVYAAHPSLKNRFRVDTSNIEAYAGNPAAVLNNNNPNFSKQEIVTESYEKYGELDDLGRCTAAIACIGEDLMPTEERGEIGEIKPTGWNQEKYPGIINSDPPYLYNRCHLIGFQLTGENANEKNLVTGTRYMNVEGMEPYECVVADYIRSSKNHVMYRVTPKFSGDNLLCDGVQIEAYSVEDSGTGICFNVYCYNVQPGIKINYSDGSNELDKDYVIPFVGAQDTDDIVSDRSNNYEIYGTDEDTEFSDNDEQENTAKEYTYVGNKRSGKFHKAGCPSIDDMAEHNKEYFYGDIDEPAAKYEPCNNCLGGSIH